MQPRRIACRKPRLVDKQLLTVVKLLLLEESTTQLICAITAKISGGRSSNVVVVRILAGC
jgi:hypothetical protein